MEKTNKNWEKKIKILLTDFAQTFAAETDEGTWWGHDTDLGDCKEEFKLAARDILKLIAQFRTQTIEEIWHLIFSSFPKDMENLSTITPDQAYRLIKEFTKKLTSLK